MNSSSYQSKIIALRLIRDRAQLVTEKRMTDILLKAYADTVRLMSLAGPDTLTYENYAARRAALKAIIDEMSGGFNMLTRLAIRNVADNTAAAYLDASQSFAGSRGFQFDWTDGFSVIPQMAARNTVARLWADGQTFSDRIWNLNKYTSEALDKIIGAGVSRGESAVNLSKDIQNFLINPTIDVGTSWTTAIQKSATGRGTVHYNALRLARTEINNSYRETLILSNDANPITLGVKWNVSKSHAAKPSSPDICDVWAELDEYGLGPGVYPAGRTPIDHPNGMCYLTEVLRPAAQWDEAKVTPVRSAWEREKVVAIVGEQSEAMQNAVYAQYKNVNRLLDKNQRLYRGAA